MGESHERSVGEITVGHRTFSEHFRHSDQKPIRSANLSERTCDEHARTSNAQHAPAPVR